MLRKYENIIILMIKLIAFISILPAVFILGYVIIKGVPSISWSFLAIIPFSFIRVSIYCLKSGM